MRSNTCYYDEQKRIANLGRVKTRKGESSEFTCCFCGKTFKSAQTKHTAGKVRSLENGKPQHCCTRCFKKYVVGAFSLQMRLDLADEFYPQYAHIPHDTPDEMYGFLCTCSIEELNMLLDTKSFRDSADSTIAWLAMVEEYNERKQKKEAQRKERARERARERRAAAKAAKLAAQEVK
jgi:hypothetical protein